MIKNEKGSCSAGVGWPIPGNPTLAWAWPEVWVNDEDYEDAIPLAEEFKKIADNSHGMSQT